MTSSGILCHVYSIVYWLMLSVLFQEYFIGDPAKSFKHLAYILVSLYNVCISYIHFMSI